MVLNRKRMRDWLGAGDLVRRQGDMRMRMRWEFD